MTRRIIGLAGLVAAVTVAPAAATDGSLYVQGPSPTWAHAPSVSVTATAPGTFLVQAPALNPAAAGDLFVMLWGCPVGGSQIESVLFGGQRTQRESSLEVLVTGDGQRIWAIPDQQLSPTGATYAVALPPGHCQVRLHLRQVESRAQHARGYYVDQPRVHVRDVAPPVIALRGVGGEWISTVRGSLRIDWSTADNFGSDGIGVQHLRVAGQTVWSGAPGVGDHAAEVAMNGVPDGIHPVEAIVDGDGTPGGHTAGGAVRVDRTGPAASGLAPVYDGTPGAAGFAWSADDATSGVAGVTVEVNTAANGTTGGTWTPVGSTVGGGAGALPPRRLDLPDGAHAWRLRVTDVAGNTTLQPSAAPVVVDTTPPRLDLHDRRDGWVARGEVDLTAMDNAQSSLGIGAVEIDVNSAPDGGEGGEWQRRGGGAGAPGRRVVPVTLDGLADGAHLVRVVLRNGGAFGAHLTTEARTVIRVDRTPPVVSRAGFAPGGPGSLAASWIADDSTAGVVSVSVQWRDGSAWRTVGTAAATDGTGRMVLDVAALPPGRRSFRLVATDGAGNSASRSGTATITAGPGGAGSTARDPLARLRRARLSVSVAGALTTRRGGRAVLTRRITIGGSVVIRGRLRDAQGKAVVGAEVRVRGHRGRVIASTLTRRDGTFRITTRPRAGGVLRIGVPAGRTLLPARASHDVRVEVAPRVGLAASTTVAGVGEDVLFTGRLMPTPGSLGFGDRKGVVLEWLDPLRKTWRPVVNARVKRDGTYAIPWRFNLQGLTIPMRVTVPVEVGWPLLPTRSAVVKVAVR
ncbi:MAG: hypothetical protein AB7V42_13225 [Thermoleophilia bacterium]